MTAFGLYLDIVAKRGEHFRALMRQDAVGRMVFTNECLWKCVLPKWQEDLLKRISKFQKDEG